MPYQRTDLGQRGPALEPWGGQGMAEEMGACVHGMEPGSRQRAAHDRPDRVPVGEATARCPHPDADLPCRAGRSAVTEGGDSGVADRVWQGEAIVARALAPDAELPGVPIQSIQGQGCHVPSPSAAPGQQAQHRGIAWPVGCRPVTALPQAFDVVGFHTRGEG